MQDLQFLIWHLVNLRDTTEQLMRTAINRLARFKHKQLFDELENSIETYRTLIKEHS